MIPPANQCEHAAKCREGHEHYSQAEKAQSPAFYGFLTQSPECAQDDGEYRWFDAIEQVGDLWDGAISHVGPGEYCCQCNGREYKTSASQQ